MKLAVYLAKEVAASDRKTSGAMAQDGILGSHSLVISVWGAVAFIHKKPEFGRFPIKSRQKILTTRLVMGTNFRLAVEAIRTYNIT